MNKNVNTIIDNSEKVADAVINNILNSESKSEFLESVAKNNPQKIEELIDRFSDESRVEELIELINSIDGQNSLDKLYIRIDNKKRYFGRYIAAIVVAAAVFAISFLVLNKSKESTPVVVENEQIDAPMLMLSSGDAYKLVADEKEVVKSDEKYIVAAHKVNVKDVKNKIIDKAIEYYELITPKQQTYTITLDDGTEVTLNANSKLRYSKMFASGVREVILDGEAFFNVTKSKIPFIVKVQNGYVKVHGTKFNVNGRKSGEVKTMLIEGSVGVGSSNISEVIIKPNQLAVLNSLNKSVEVKSVDSKNYIGWLSGAIRCIDSDLITLIEELKMWYGVDIRYRTEDIKNIAVNISIKHSLDILEVFRLIEKAINVEFINEGKYYEVILKKQE